MAAGEVLALLARVNLAAAAAIVLAVALRKIVRPHFGARLAYRLWLLPVLAAAAVLAPARAVIVAVAPPSADVLPFFEGALPASRPVIIAPAGLETQTLVVALWLAGVAIAALIMAHLQSRFAAEARKGMVGPAVVGVIAPRIITPADFTLKFTGEEQSLVLAHERAHIDRHDSRLNGLSAVMQCLFWFNPLIHLAAHLMRIDQEMACDETVVTRFPDARRAYAEVLVKAQLAIRPLPLGCYWPSGTEHPLLERIAMLKSQDPSRRRRLAGASALGALCAATGLAAWASQPPQVRIASAKAIAAAPAPASQTAEAPVAQAQAAPESDVVVIAKLGRLVAAATPPPPEAKSMRVAALDQAAGGEPSPPPGPRGGQPVYAKGPPIVPPPGEAPPASLDRPWDKNSAINLNEMKTIDGVVNAVKWTYPSSEIWVREAASGQLVVVNTDAANGMAAAGLNRQALRPGTPITIKGYPARDGSRLYADPAEIVVGGRASTHAPTPGLPQLVSRRLEVCGDMPVDGLFPKGGTPDPDAIKTALSSWRSGCDAKLAAAGG